MINFRQINLKDLDIIRSWRNSTDISKYMFNQDEITKEEQLLWYDKIMNENVEYYRIIDFKNIPIGLVYITDINYRFSSAYWGFYIGDPKYKDVGLGALVEFKIIEFFFYELNLNKMRCEVFSSNKSVISMHEKFGFRREAFYREHLTINDIKIDVVGMALLKNEWKSQRVFFNQFLNKK